ncbi:MAG: DUF481 domain-containing protein [Acidobacteriota bacterium]
MLTASISSAQINTERLRLGTLEPGWSGNVTTSVALEDGNSDTLNATGGLRINWALSSACGSSTAPHLEDAEETGLADESTAEESAAKGDESPAAECPAEKTYEPGIAFLSSRYTFAEENDSVSKNRGFAHLRWTTMKNPRWGWEAFLQYQFNEFLRLDQRRLAGVGLRYAIDREEHRRIFLGLAVMSEFERLDLPDLTDDEREVDTVRASSYLTLKGQSPRGAESPRFRYGTTIYVQPSLEDLGDLRLLNDNEIAFPISERVEISLSLSVLYDSEPPPGVESTDWRLRNQLRVRW